MSLERVWAIAITNFKGMFRNLKSAGIMFIIPVVFMAIFGVAFGGSVTDTTYDIGIISKSSDAGYAVFKDVLTDITTREDSEVPLFDVTEFDSIEDAEQAIKDDQIILFLDLSDNFLPGNPEAKINVSGDLTNSTYAQFASVIQQISGIYLDKDIEYISISGIDGVEAQDFNAFDFLAPGLIVYALLILSPGVAQNFTELTDKKYTFRYFTSKARAIEIIAGNTIYQVVLALIQTMIAYATAVLFGFQANGNILLALLLAVPTALFVVGLGLTIGSFVKKPDAATNIATIISIVLGFFSGSFISGIGAIYEFEAFGRTLQFNDVFPTKWATVAMERVLKDGAGFEQISGEFFGLLISGIIFFVVGTLVYNQRQLKRVG